LHNSEICAHWLDLSFAWDNPISPRIFLEWLSGPKDLIYALDEKPSPLQLLALGFQRVAVICPYLVMVALVASAAKLPYTEARNAMAWAMIAVGFLTVPQSVCIGRVGSGYLCPPVVSAIYLPSSITAASHLDSRSSVAWLSSLVLARRWLEGWSTDCASSSPRWFLLS
jgi:hypothetical protein